MSDAEAQIAACMKQCPDYLDYPTSWAIQKAVGTTLTHHPRCSSVPGWDPISGPGFLCDCGAVVKEWERRKSRTAPHPGVGSPGTAAGSSPEGGVMGELQIAIARGPKCPKCGEDRFDDWWHEPSMKTAAGTIRGKLRCHGCGRFFSVTHYADGETHSRMMRAAR